MLRMDLPRFQNVRKTILRYPYNSIGGWFSFASFILLKSMPRIAYPRMSLVPILRKHFRLSSDEEFRVHYYVSRIAFANSWRTNRKSGRDDFESFYREQDGDLWRQAFISKNDYMYKKKILSVYQAVNALIPKNDRILDYGCGAGAIANYFVEKGYRKVHAADIPSATLDFVRTALGGKLEKIIAIDPSWERPRTDFDPEYGAIMALDCLEHTFAPLSIVKNLISRLRPGGLFIVTFPVETDFSSTHTREAQHERPLTFDYLRSVADELVPEFIYLKRS